MTETAAVIVQDALADISVRAAELPLTADEISTGIRYLNRLMGRLDASGISLGFTTITAPNQAVTVPDGAVDGVVANLSVALAPQFKKQISQELALRARDGLNAMRVIAVGIGAAEFPSTLPRGSGNETETFNSQHFYDDLQSGLLTETDGTITLEEGT